MAALTAAAILAACTTTNDIDAQVANSPSRRDPAASPSQSVASGKSPLCQPFPDRLIDEFLAAYNGRSLEALKELIVAPEVEDIVVGAYGASSSSFDVEAWARAAWDAGDRIRNSGYSAFHPSKNGFQMLITRTGDELSDAGIAKVSMALNADTDGCSITSLESAGPVQSIGNPCAFYSAFRHVQVVTDAEPSSCEDGSARFARSGPVSAAVEGQVVIWGGARGGHFTYGDLAMDGLIVDPRSRRAARIPALDLPAFRPEAHAWTGNELIVIGTKARPDYGLVAAAFSPSSSTWRRVGFPFQRAGGFEGVWTGREFLLWGGPDHSEKPSLRGLAYNPATDNWRKTAPAPTGGRWSHAVVWTGTEMIVFGGGNADSDLAAGLAYNPGTDTWGHIASSPLSPRQWLPLTWTGDEVVVWGGSSVSRSVADGAAYDPSTDRWRKLPKSPLKGRHYHSATWTGSEVIVFGGYNYRRSFADGAAYDPAADRWRRLLKAPVKPRFDHSAVWTGTHLLFFGGIWEFGHTSLGDGATYDPTSNQWRRLVPRLSR
ncbi:MAG: Kelch repeat-containing protein [Actinomycetota bacterium]